MPLMERLDPVDVGLPGVERSRLIACSRPDLTLVRPRVKIGVGSGSGHLLKRPLNPDLSPQAFPVKQQRCLHILLDLFAFVAFGIGEKRESARPTFLGSMVLRRCKSLPSR